MTEEEINRQSSCLMPWAVWTVWRHSAAVGAEEEAGGAAQHGLGNGAAMAGDQVPPATGEEEGLLEEGCGEGEGQSRTLGQPEWWWIAPRQVGRWLISAGAACLLACTGEPPAGVLHVGGRAVHRLPPLEHPGRGDRGRAAARKREVGEGPPPLSSSWALPSWWPWVDDACCRHAACFPISSRTDEAEIQCVHTQAACVVQVSAVMATTTGSERSGG